MQLARPAGFEPTTPWFVARYSNPTELRARGRHYSKRADRARNAPYFARDRLEPDFDFDPLDERELDDFRLDDPLRDEPLRLDDLRAEDDRLLLDLRFDAVDFRAVLFFAALPRDVLFFAGFRVLFFALLLFFAVLLFFAADFFADLRGGPPPLSRALFSAMAIACFCAFFRLRGLLVPIEPFLSYECISLRMLLLIVPRLEPFFKGMVCSFR